MADKGSTESAPVERKLAAILAADFAGYSRLMHEDEEGTLATLAKHREIIDGLVQTANGKIFATGGDSVLAEFPSIVETFHCAIAIQQSLRRVNAALPEEQRMLLRIGIHVGDVMVTDDDLIGEGVNIAARLEGLADPGGICASRVARDHLRDRVSATFEDLGERQVKNIPRPLRVFKIVFDPDAEPAIPSALHRDPAADAPEVATEPANEESDSAQIAFWQSVQASDDEAEYRIYLERYPQGTFAELAKARLKSASAVDHPGVEVAFWETVRDSGNAAMLRAYLERYPRGEFKSLAEIMLAELDRPSG
jgi:class 3 adenylate cyclase